MAPTTKAAITLAFASAVDAFSSVNYGNGFLAGGMQPDVAAHTLASVEEEWQAQASMFVECSNSTGDIGSDPLVDCQRAPKAFAKSCSKVVSAMVRGSNGDRDDAKEYLADVCSQDELKGLRAERCQGLADGITNLMTSDNWENKNNLKSDSLCSNMWSQLLEQQQVSIQRDHQMDELREAQLAKEAAEDAASRSIKQKQAAEAASKAAEATRKQAEKEATAKAVQTKRAKAKTDAEAKANLVVAKADAEAKAKAHKEAEKVRVANPIPQKKAENVEKKTEKTVEKKDEKKTEKTVEKKDEKKAEKKVEKAATTKALTEEKPQVAPMKLVIGHKKVV